MVEYFKSFSRCETGATAIEYGLIVALIVVAILGALMGTGIATQGMYETMDAIINVLA